MAWSVSLSLLPVLLIILTTIVPPGIPECSARHTDEFGCSAIVLCGVSRYPSSSAPIDMVSPFSSLKSALPSETACIPRAGSIARYVDSPRFTLFGDGKSDSGAGRLVASLAAISHEGRGSISNSTRVIPLASIAQEPLYKKTGALGPTLTDFVSSRTLRAW